ncbi:MAG: DUF6901 family protein [Elusimicrobiota bacterium]
MLIKYRFVFKDGKEEAFDINLDPESISYQGDASEPPPDWTRLTNNKCRNCPLSENDHAHCPVARNLAPVLTRFIDRISFEEVDLIVTTDAREYRKRISLQRGISAIFGLIMATSGCPILDKLRPMAFTHLPMAELEETRYRAISMYLMAQFFRLRKGLSADWGLKGLERIYGEIGVVNRDFVARLRTIEMQDANFNAVVGLDCFCLSSASMMTRSIEKLERIFSTYL